MKLTDEDRATLDRLWESADDYAQYIDIENGYLAGLRAGMLRAAKICDDMTKTNMDSLEDGATEACATAIKAAAQE